MKTVYRRLLLASLYLASLAIVAIITLYAGRNFTGAGPIPARSAFAGRLPSVEDGDWRRFQFFSGHGRRHQPQHVECADQVDFDHAPEQVQFVRPVLPTTRAAPRMPAHCTTPLSGP